MKRWLDCGMEAATPEGRRAVVRLMWWFVGLSVVVAAAIVGAKLVLEASEGLSVLARAAITLLPVIPFVAMFAIFARTYRHLDEMVVRVQSEALALALAATVVVAVAWGQLQRAELLPDVDLMVVWPLAAFAYGGCLLFVRRRYR